MATRMRLLTFTTLYPNARQPSHGVFVENRLRELIGSGRVESRVVAPVPWVPAWLEAHSRHGHLAAIPAREWRHGLSVAHPRYALAPRIGMNLAPFALYLAGARAAEALLAEGYDFDLIDAHYFYPDGVAAALLARRFNRPLTITGRGSDLNLIPRYRLPRTMIAWAARAADGLITVCDALHRPLREMGIAPERITTLRNGVDLRRFHPIERDGARARRGLSGLVLASVGHLITRKGHDRVIEALTDLPEATLLIAGDGPEEGALRALARNLGVDARVRFLGRLAHDALAEVYGVADLLVLASSREGWANVLLEAMACGTPVVATRVWGTPEVVAAPEAGALVERDGPSIARGVRAVLARAIDRRATRAYAERFSWDETTEGQIRLFESILARFRACMIAHPHALGAGD
jgi:glycosyltransferase involved in cell wall biosynthesis